MKKSLFSIYLIVFTFQLIAQELPDIPMKNGKVYYSFNHKLNNSKNCLSKYYSTDFIIKLNSKTQSFNYKLNTDRSIKEKAGNIGVFSITLSIAPKSNIKSIDAYSNLSLTCKDTALSKYNFIKFPTNKKEGKSKEITFSVETIFIDKNSYKLVFKGFVLKESYIKNGTVMIDEVNLEERYNEILANAKKPEIEVSFFNKLNDILIELDKMYESVFEQEYSTDEQ